jgi:hypothetical protein
LPNIFTTQESHDDKWSLHCKDKMYFLFIIWTFFLDTQKKICSNNKKEIYNDKYRHTRDRVFGLFKASVVVLFCSDIFWSFIRIFYCYVEKGNICNCIYCIILSLSKGLVMGRSWTSIHLKSVKCIWYICTTWTSKTTTDIILCMEEGLSIEDW